MYIPSAQIWFGSHELLVQKALAYSKKIWCRADICNKCIICRQVSEKNYYALLWMVPEKNGYTVAQLELLDKRTSFMANEGEHFLIVYERAHLLSNACSNRLLKIVEEPPRGYHFLFLSESQDMMAPTLVSRCLIDKSDERELSVHPMVELFTQKSVSYDQFARVSSAQKITEQETRGVLDAIVHYWQLQYRDHRFRIDTDAIEQRLEILLKAYAQLPMPGSALFFWRNLFLHMRQIS